MKINISEFINNYRHVYGSKGNAALTDLLKIIAADESFDDSFKSRAQVAYFLATAKIETADTFRPIHEYGSTNYFNSRYNKNTKVGKDLGNTQPGDGARFAGRGFVQLTGRKNYHRAGEEIGVDLINNPELALQMENAYKIAITGMREGWFTRRKFNDYIFATKADFEGARHIINGTDRAEEIAQIAGQLMTILSNSKLEEIIAQPQSDTPNEPIEAETQIERAKDWTGGNAYVDSVSPQTQTIKTDDKTVSVPQISAEREPDKQPGGIQAYIVAATTFVTAVGAFIRDNRIEIVYLIVIVGVVWFVARYLYKAHTENLNNIAREAREQRAHILQLAVVNAAASKKLNNILIVPTPLRNSENDSAPATEI